MASPCSIDHRVNMIKVHLEENTIEHADNLLLLLNERLSKGLQLRPPEKINACLQPFSPCKSPVSHFQFNHRGCSCHHRQHDLSSVSNSSFISNPGSNGKQGSRCNEGQVHCACTLDISDELESLPSLNSTKDGKQSSSLRKSRTLSGQQSPWTESSNGFTSSSSLTLSYNHSNKRTLSHNACIHSPSSPIQKSIVGVGTNLLEDSVNKLRASSSPRSPSSRPLHPHLQHRHSSPTAELHSFTSPQVSPAGDSPNLSDASLALRTSLSKARQIQWQIEACGRKLEYASQRVPALELAMRPLTSDSADTRELCSFIDQTTAPVQAFLEALKTVKRLAPAIRAGPASEGGVGMYLEQLSSLESSLKFLQGHSTHVVQLLQGTIGVLGGSRVIDKFSLFKFKEILATIQLDPSFHPDQQSLGLELLECASIHLESHFAHIISMNALVVQLPANPADSPHHEAVALLPEESLHALQAIATNLSFKGKLHQCLCIYEKAREVAIRKSLKGLGISARYLRHSSTEAVQALQWETLEEHITTWLNHMEVVVRILLLSERKLISHVFDQLCDSTSRLQLQACFARLALKGALQHWLKFGVAVARSRREPQKLFKLLDMFECIEGLRPIVVKVVLRGEACKQARQHMFTLQREVGKAAFQVLRAFGAQVEGDEGAVAPSNGGVMRLSSYVVNYIKCLVGESYRSRVERIMRDEAGDGDHLKATLLLIMQALERNIESKAKRLRASHPALGQLFLMNNHWYIYTRSRSTEIATILGAPWLKQHKLRSEKCAMRYRRQAWGALLSVLSGPDGLPLSLGSSGVSRHLFRQRIIEFEDAFAELYRVHESWSVPDPLLRPQLGITVLHTFVPMLAALYGQFAPFLPSALQMAYTPQRIQQMIAALFRLPEDILKSPIQELANAPANMRSFH